VIYELKSIQPIEFALVDSQGPSHKPTFRERLTISLTNDATTSTESFFGEGNTRKNAKKLASISCLYHLINKKKLANINSGFIQMAIQADFKTLNLAKSFEEYFSIQEDNIPDSCDDEDSTEKALHIDTDPPTINKIDSNDFIDAKKKPLMDAKTQEVIASRNVLSILNHMLQTTDYAFNELEENIQFNNKFFKVELAIQKNEKFYARCSGYEEHLRNMNASKSKLIFESRTEYRFHGQASNKKSARLRSAQLALEKIFDLRIVPSDLDTNLSVSEDMAAAPSDISLFADNISEVIKEKYYNLLSLLEREIQNKKMSVDEEGIDEDLELTSQNKLRGVYAGIVQSVGLSSESAKLICVTTGTKCICGEFMSQNGYAVNDW